MRERISSDYPRPQFQRADAWCSLDGVWDFRFDDAGAGLRELWYDAFPEDARTIRVPFAYQTKASGIGVKEDHEVLWYRRSFTVDAERARGRRQLLHFEGSDFETRVWVNGAFIGSHTGAYSRFTFDITEAVRDGENTLTVRVKDTRSVEQARGKQSWRDEVYSVFYTPVSGIWKPVWLESVPETHLEAVHMVPDVVHKRVSFAFDAAIAPGDAGACTLEAEILFDEIPIRTVSLGLFQVHQELDVDLYTDRLAPSEELAAAWSPDHPQLYDVIFRIRKDGAVIDEVQSYFGLRDIRTERGWFLLNNQPLRLRMVLDQGYWEESLLTAPSDEALRADVEAIKRMGFNGVRIHQKTEDERFLYWCDRLGLAVWGETAACFAYSDASSGAFLTEWESIVKQYANHPSIVAWTPFNESWGIPDVAHVRVQQDFVRSVVYRTKSLDPTRPVISNDGWEHVASDIFTIHDYTLDEDVIRRRYASIRETLYAGAPFLPGRPLLADGAAYEGQPIIISEYGGMGRAEDLTEPGSWGARGPGEDLLSRLEAVTRAFAESPAVAGYCLTQFTDVEQEKNGLLTIGREEKFPADEIRRINAVRSSAGL